MRIINGYGKQAVASGALNASLDRGVASPLDSTTVSVSQYPCITQLS